MFSRALFLIAGVACAQNQPLRLTIQEAEKIALQNQPRIKAARLNAQAAEQVVTETRSANFPTAYGSLTGVGADNGSRIAAGSLTNPAVYERLAGGVGINQLLTDFGRTRNLVESAKLRAQSRTQSAAAATDEVLLTVDRAYYALQRAQNILTVAEQTIKARQLVFDQVDALAKSSLKSTLDVSFANVNLSEAKLFDISARNDAAAAAADLSSAIGLAAPESFELADQTIPPPLAGDAEAFVKDALSKRPDLASFRSERDAAGRFARAERALSYPTISATATAGYVPLRVIQVDSRYAAAGVNVNIPIFNGHLFSARHNEAELRAQEAEQRIQDLKNRISRDVRVAYLDALTAFQRLALTAQLREQARISLDLAQGRYDLGLSSIVELSQAQLNLTSAEIGTAAAKYDYESRRATLDFTVGR